VSAVEGRLRAALTAGAAAVEDSPDLFARVTLSIEEDRRRRARRWRAIGVVASIVGALAAIVAAVTDIREGELLMDWWILELISTLVLVGVALWLGPLIKRYGKSYAADVFRANPRTGKSFIVLTDFAYYLIFFAYILFTVSFEPKGGWAQTVNASQLQHESARLGGILLIIGLLHGVNLLALPIMGRLLTLNRQLDEAVPPPPTPPPVTPEPRPATPSP
jgi:type III secretory pathway component EscS